MLSRPRRPEDWERDLNAAKPAEEAFAAELATDPRLVDLERHTDSFDKLDFSFTYGGRRIWVDLKEKKKPYSTGVQALWEDVPGSFLFIVDETVYRRIVWQGGGGYLVVHDLPGSRWAIFGPWELTLGPRRRYAREEQKKTKFLKGKILLDLRAAATLRSYFSIDELLHVIDKSVAQRDAVEAVATNTLDLPEV
ncbi:MAG TPA: hypothetical protein VHI71_00145 [Actinomycetota bacterium]|nr:hypothetical protein [Actinomycetota bacterium]